MAYKGGYIVLAASLAKCHLCESTTITWEVRKLYHLQTDDEFFNERQVFYICDSCIKMPDEAFCMAIELIK